MTDKDSTIQPLPSRLDRIEKKLDEVSSVLVEIAKTQQQMIYLEERLNHQSASIHEINNHVEEIRKKIPGYDSMLDLKDRMVLIVLSTMLLGVLALLGFKFLPS